MPHNQSTPESINGVRVPAEMVQAYVDLAPIKNIPQPEHADLAVRQDLLYEQLNLVAANMYQLPSYLGVYSTCSDERPRKGLLNGHATSRRYSIFGGSTIYGTSILELTGQAQGDSAEDRVEDADVRLGLVGFKRGGHVACAAANGINLWMGKIKDDPQVYMDFAESQLGETYDQAAANYVVKQASRVHDQAIYKDYSEKDLQAFYGDEAGETIEVLEDVDHEAMTVVRIHRKLTVVDFNPIYTKSKVGKGSFIVNDGYADAIEQALTSGPDAAQKKLIAEHAREMIVGAVANSVPNNLLFLGHIR